MKTTGKEPSFLKAIAERIAALKMDILKESSPLLLGLFTIMFGLHADYSISRAMGTLVPAGVGHFQSEPFVIASWRVICMVICAVLICIIFIHASITIIKMRLHGPLMSIYLKAFFAFFLSLSPWVTFHIARLIAALFVPDIFISVDIIFISMYAGGVLFLSATTKFVDRLFK